MNTKTDFDQALEYILETGSGSELSELSDSQSEEEPILQPLFRIKGDKTEDTNANTNESSGDLENEENISNFLDKSNERNQ